MSSNLTPLSDVVSVEVPFRPAVRDVNCIPRDQAANVVRVGVIGYGYWGPNIVRNLHSLDNCDVVAVCDKSQAALKIASRTYPGIQRTTEIADVLTSPDIDAVAIVTPVWTHFALAKEALENGK